MQATPDHDLVRGMQSDPQCSTFSTLLSSLRMLCDSAETGSVCQPTATAFLLGLFESGAPFGDAIKNLVANFDEPMRKVLHELVSSVEAP